MPRLEALLLAAMAALDSQPERWILISDPTTDITAAHAARMAVIGYADKSGKRAQFQAFGPTAIIDTMSEVAEALGRPSKAPTL
jgi:beta-phosphoglucomutase-like phosphatase (HAD superfamily)